jgi:hypothetical protein
MIRRLELMGSRWIHSIHTTNHAPDKPNNIKWQTLFQKVADTFFLGGKHFFLHRSI